MYRLVSSPGHYGQNSYLKNDLQMLFHKKVNQKIIERLSFKMRTIEKFEKSK